MAIEMNQTTQPSIIQALMRSAQTAAPAAASQATSPTAGVPSSPVADGAVLPGWESDPLGNSAMPAHTVEAMDRAAPPPPDESNLPIGLERFPYGSGDVPLVAIPEEEIHLHGGIGTPPEVAELVKYGVANVFSPEWQAFLEYAVRANGGLGDAENGYLAFSKEYGFVRFDHPGLTPEQNRRIAAISLQTGWPIERLPGRNLEEDCFSDPEANAWVDDFIGRFDGEMSSFIADPTQELLVKSGSRNRYLMKFDPESGRVFSTEYRKKGGFAGYVSDHFDVIAPVLDGISIVATALAQPEIAAGLQTVKQGLVTSITGEFTPSQGLSIATSWLAGPALENTALGQALNSQFGRAGLAIAADLAADGRIDASTLVGAIAPQILRGLPGGPAVDLALQRGSQILSRKIEGKEVGLSELYSAFAPLVVGLENAADRYEVRDLIRNAGVAGDPANPGAWMPLLANLTSDPQELRLIADGLSTLVHYVDNGELDPRDLVHMFTHYFKDDLDALKESLKATPGLPARR